MKLLLFNLFIISFIYLSQTQEILKPTNYTLDYLEKFDTKISCQSDNECPEYSKCVKNDDDSTISTCQFGNFLCPKEFKDYFTINEMVGNCTFVNTEVWDLDKEQYVNNTPNPSSQPILKICPNSNKCKTERCTKDEDCFSGLCHNNVCVKNYNIAHEIYRCSGTDAKVKCGKQLGMYCNNNDECYSGICNSNYCSNTKAPSPLLSIFYGFLNGALIVAVIYIIILIAILIHDGINGYESDHYWRSFYHLMLSLSGMAIKYYSLYFVIYLGFIYFIKMIQSS